MPGHNSGHKLVTRCSLAGDQTRREWARRSSDDDRHAEGKTEVGGGNSRDPTTSHPELRQGGTVQARASGPGGLKVRLERFRPKDETVFPPLDCLEPVMKVEGTSGLVEGVDDHVPAADLRGGGGGARQGAGEQL